VKWDRKTWCGRV